MRKKVISMAAAIAVTAILMYTFFRIQKGQIEATNNSNRLLAMQKLVSVSDGIQSELNESLQYADFFDVIISNNPDTTKETINDYSRLILKQNKNIDSVQLAPNAIVSMIYPLKGNEAAMEHNLLNDPERKSYVEQTIEKRIPVTQGPVKSKQGKYLVFNRKAIFIMENEEEKFWGLSIIGINFTKLIEKYEKKLQDENYLFAIKTNKEEKGQKNLWGDYEIFNKDVIVKTIELPDNQWQIAIYPQKGWNQGSSSLQNLSYLFYIVALLSFFLVYWCVNFYQERIEEAKKEVLTGTLNKKAFKDFVQKKLSKKNQNHGIILIDLNNFKEINDKLGHPVGDAVLIEVSKRINGMLRSVDRLSRFGGDEYLVFISNIKNEDTVKQIMDKISERISLPMVIDELHLKIGISAGYTVYPNDGQNFDKLYEIADKKMYENKEKNRLFNKSECLDD